MTEDNRTVLATLLTGILVASTVVGAAGVFVGTAAAEQSATIDADSLEAGATTTHNASVTVGSSDTQLEYVEITYTGGADPSNANLVDAYIEREGDGDTDPDESLSLSPSADGQTLTFTYTGSTRPTLSTGDRVVVVYDDVDNPTQNGGQAVSLSVNGNNAIDGQLNIEDTDPEISDFDADGTGDLDVQLSFESDEALSSADVQMNGPESTSFTVSDFAREEAEDGDFEYSTTYDASAQGTYEVTLNSVTDRTDNTVSPGTTTNVTLSNTALAATGVSVEPADVEPGAAVDQTVTATFEGVSADGGADEVQIRFPDSASLSAASANQSGGDSLGDSAELVDGDDSDGATDTVEFEVQTGSGSAPATITAQADVTVTYNDTGQHEVNATIFDSNRGSASGTATVSAASSTGSSSSSDGGANAVPYNGTNQATTNGTAEIEDFELYADGGDVKVNVTSSAPLDGITVEMEETTLTRADFTARSAGDGTKYVADVPVSTWGTYNATLETARTSSGTDIADGESDELELQEPDVNVELVANGTDVDLVVEADENYDQLVVDVSGATSDTVSMSEFTTNASGNRTVYRADITSDADGEINASLQSVNGMRSTDGSIASDSVTVGTSASVNGSTQSPATDQTATPASNASSSGSSSSSSSVSDSSSSSNSSSSGDSGGSDSTPTSGSGPGFGALVALVALVASAMLAARRRE